MEQRSKKNLSGGKGFKRRGGENHGARKNRETTTAYVEDVCAGEDVPELFLARTQRLQGGNRMTVQTVAGAVVTASVRNLLRCKGTAAKKSDNPVAITVGTFVLLQEEEYGSQIVGVFSRKHVQQLEEHFPAAPRGFFAQEEGLDDAGFDWDLSEEPAATPAPAPAAPTKRPATADDDLDVDAI